MKTMKPALLALCLSLGMAACGNSNSESSTADTSVIIAAPPADTTNMNADGTQNAANSAAKGEASGINPDSTNTSNTDNMRK